MPTDGRDVVNGGTEGGLGDTFVVTGNASSETYSIYTRAAWDALPGNNTNVLNGATEIVITRNGTNAAAIIAELREIEEIRINSVDPSGTTGGAGPGDTFNIVGDFSTTSLRLNTITIDGEAGDDTIDISSLGSAHRIVFKSNGGNDTIIGALRAEDVIEFPEGADLSDLRPDRERERHEDHLERHPLGHLHRRRAAAVPGRRPRRGAAGRGAAGRGAGRRRSDAAGER